MNLLVTGCAGFIGSNFVYHILDAHKEHHLIGLDKLTYAGNLENLTSLSDSDKKRFEFVKGDICDRELLLSLFRKVDVDAVINFAAETHVDRSIHDSQVFLQTNVMGTHALLESAKAAWFSNGVWKSNKKFVQISTDEVYGSLGPTGLFTEKTPLDPHSPYSASKASADMLVKSFGDTYGMPIAITRCSNNYGPYQFPEKLIPLMIRNALMHKELPVYGDGLQVRDWLHVKDHCTAIDCVLHQAAPGSILNIGGNSERKNIELVHLILDTLRSLTKDEQINHSLVRHVKDRLGHDRRYGIDHSLITNTCQWKPSIMLEKGIPETIQWYLSNKAWMERVISGEYVHFYNQNYSHR